MLSRIIYCAAVLLATIAVVLLALFSPQPYRKINTTPFLSLSFYIQQPQVTEADTPPVAPPPPLPPAGALIFHHTLTAGPENTSTVVGKAQGFIIPVESFAHSAFNIIYLTLHTQEYSGSISIQAKNLAQKEREELNVVGGTGSFAFVHGLAILATTDEAIYHIKLHLKFSNGS